MRINLKYGKGGLIFFVFNWTYKKKFHIKADKND